MPADLQELETRLGYTFRERGLLVRALTHKSFSAELPQQHDQFDNEQLEFFGDSILGFLVSEALVLEHPNLSEGRLSKTKSQLVSAVHLQQVARSLKLGDFLHLGRGEEKGGGREKPSLLANAVEALIAALYVDGGLEAARAFVSEWVLAGHLNAVLQQESTNYKGELDEKAKAAGLPSPVYFVLEETGPAHARTFLMGVRVGERYTNRGSGPSKKVAAQQAARALLDQLTEGFTTGA